MDDDRPFPALRISSLTILRISSRSLIPMLLLSISDTILASASYTVCLILLLAFMSVLS
ncbi:MAG: hypothetical protein QW374_04890 [Candidatus Bathyarchaeia archaeon]